MMNKVIKRYRYYLFNEDYTLKELCVTVSILELETPVLSKNEFGALKYSLESNDGLSDFLYDLCRLYYTDEMSYDSFEKLTKILVNKENFYVEVFERVDS